MAKHSPSMFEALCPVLSSEEGEDDGAAKNVSGLGCNSVVGHKPNIHKIVGSTPRQKGRQEDRPTLFRNNNNHY